MGSHGGNCLKICMYGPHDQRKKWGKGQTNPSKIRGLVHLNIHGNVYLSLSLCLSISGNIYLSLSLCVCVCLSIYLSLSLSVYLSQCLSTNLCVYLTIVIIMCFYLSISYYVYLSLSVSINLLTWQCQSSISLIVYLPIFVSI